MVDKIQKEIYRFRNEKGIEPNALMLGAEVVNELMQSCNLTVVRNNNTSVSYVCGFPLFSINYCDTKMIAPILI